jgi:hypothetical protein
MAYLEKRRGRVIAHVSKAGKRYSKSFDTKIEAQTSV